LWFASFFAKKKQLPQDFFWVPSQKSRHLPTIFGNLVAAPPLPKKVMLTHILFSGA